MPSTPYSFYCDVTTACPTPNPTPSSRSVGSLESMVPGDTVAEGDTIGNIGGNSLLSALSESDEGKTAERCSSALVPLCHRVI